VKNLSIAPQTSLMKNKAIKFEGISTPEQLFATIADLPWSIWLDSCESDHVDSQYDIIVWQPEITLTTHGENTKINFLGDTHNCSASLNKSLDETVSQEDPFTLVKKLQDELFNSIAIDECSLPFKGGSVGFWGYDLAHRFEKLPATTQQDISLPDMAIGIYLHAVVFNRKDKIFYLVSLEEHSDDLEDTLNRQIADSKVKQQTAFNLTTPWQSNISKADYVDKFNQVQAYLLSGDCYQINLAQRFSSHYQGNEFTAYQALRNENEAPFSAFIRLENAAILSISPERFLQLEQSKVQSKPIKGTRPRNEDKLIDQKIADELQQAVKDRAENVMIVDLLRNDISKVCLPGSVKVPALFEIESFPAVHHLVSTVEGKLEAKFHGTDLLRAAFPGGSITGAPKIRAMEIIDQLEPNHRSLYCGSIGYISACGNMDTSITIRTLICDASKASNTIYCWAGGGLVADSEVDCEYQETFDKVQRILPVLSRLT